MASYKQTLDFPPRLWMALITTIVAFAVALLASLNLYLLEDANPLTQAAYTASPLLRFSYDGVYLSALVAGIAFFAIVAYTITPANILVIPGLVIVTLIVLLGGFGGLLVRQPVSFFVSFIIFVSLNLMSILIGRAVASRFRHRLGQRPALILGACFNAGIALLVNVVALILHTLALNPVNHTLFMQGQIGGTHLNSLVIALSIEILTMLLCMSSIGLAFRSPA